MELWNDALVATCEGQSRRRLSHPRLSANTAMLRTACFLCVIGHRELLAGDGGVGEMGEGAPPTPSTGDLGRGGEAGPIGSVPGGDGLPPDFSRSVCTLSTLRTPTRSRFALKNVRAIGLISITSAGVAFS